MADATDLKSVADKAYGFKSRSGYQRFRLLPRRGGPLENVTREVFLMKRLFLLIRLVSGALDLAALRTGDKAVELPRLKFINGVQTPVALPLKQDVLRVYGICAAYVQAAFFLRGLSRYETFCRTSLRSIRPAGASISLSLNTPRQSQSPVSNGQT